MKAASRVILVVVMVVLFETQIKECKRANGILVRGISGWGTGHVCIHSKEID